MASDRPGTPPAGSSLPQSCGLGCLTVVVGVVAGFEADALAVDITTDSRAYCADMAWPVPSDLEPYPPRSDAVDGCRTCRPTSPAYRWASPWRGGFCEGARSGSGRQSDASAGCSSSARRSPATCRSTSQPKPGTTRRHAARPATRPGGRAGSRYAPRTRPRRSTPATAGEPRAPDIAPEGGPGSHPPRTSPHNAKIPPDHKDRTGSRDRSRAELVNSRWVELRGFEPLAPSMRTRCATGLRHSPNEKKL